MQKRQSILPYASRTERRQPESISKYKRTQLASAIRRDRGYDKKNLWINQRTSLRKAMARLRTNLAIRASNVVEKEGKCTVLDIGCHDGTTLAELKKEVPKIEAHGISLSRAKEWSSPERKGIKFHVGLFETNKLPSEHFDLIYGNSSIIHSKDFSKTIRQMHRILKKGGETVFDIQVPPSAENTRFILEKFDVLQHYAPQPNPDENPHIVLHLKKK
jgi:ubiquinone/menaquinone biosynthesis C-methylase UbiE